MKLTTLLEAEGFLHQHPMLAILIVVVPPNGSWYFIAARDDEEEFEERSQSLKTMWMHLKANLSNFKSIEEPETTVLECEFVEDEISHELFQELTFTHYNTIKSS